ncbi:EAL domain-containing protein [Sulfurimonas sp. NW15]|uniref:putative bifunctional diguanylate cyclase/phosphodiesterase n=1 Tax=Sulfurimonas sp. NW15 TaxID=2922729 RepID=UPI003DA90EDB
MKKENQIKYELMRLMALDSYASSVSLLFIVTVVAALFWQETALRVPLAVWLLSLYTVLILRSYYVRQFLQNKTNLQKAQTIFNFSTIFSALLTSAGFLFLFTVADHVHQTFIIIIISGTSAGAVITLSYFKKLSISYLFVLLLPLVYTLLAHKSNAFNALSYLIILFLVMLSIFSAKYNKNIVTTLISKYKILATKKALEVSKNNFESIFKELPIGVFTYSKDLVLTQVNKAFAKIIKVPQEKLFNLDMKTLKDKSIIEPLQKVFKNEKAVYEGIYHTTLTDLDLWIRLHAIPMYDAQGNIISGLGMVEDITTEVQNQKKLEYQAFYDSLTGLTNRASFRNYLEQFMKKIHRSKEYGALLFIDLDDFKNINDSIGHDVGDYVLQIFAQRIRKVLRAEDIFARLGGDEFVILLSQTDANLAKMHETALYLSEKIHTTLKEPIHKENETLYISLSIGIKILTPEELDTTTILKHADIAMYESKKGGKNKTSFYDSAMSRQIQEQLLLHNELKIAIQEKQFELYLQPIVETKTGKIVSAEALIRWNHPTKGLLFPDAFIEYAEQSSLIINIGSWVIENAFAMYKELEDTLENIAVNISLKQFSQDNFEELLLASAKKHNVHPRCIKLELTESVMLNNLEKTIDKMLHIKAHGFAFSMDDFGTGYSSLSYLKNLPFDYLKIDQSFVRDMLENENDKKLVKIIIDVAKQFDFSVIAEGVETVEHAHFIEENGCDYYQGYLISKPVPLAEFKKLF